MRGFPVIIEKGGDGDGANSSDLPRGVTVGATPRQAEEKMYDATAFHFEGLEQNGHALSQSENGRHTWPCPSRDSIPRGCRKPYT